MAAAQAITINKERETDTTKDADGKTGEQKSDRRWDEKEIQWLILGFPHSKCRFFGAIYPYFQHSMPCGYDIVIHLQEAWSNPVSSGI